MGVSTRSWGEADGKEAHLYSLESGGSTAEISDFGATLVSLLLPDREGTKLDVMLGYDDINGYIKDEKSCYFGMTIGRYANRIAGGRFSLGGMEYTLARNNGDNHLHGGRRGFGQRMWETVSLGHSAVELRYVSPDGEEGYPGRMTATVEYALGAGGLSIHYSAQCDADTVVNLTNHAYFNLAGCGSGSVLGQFVQINADSYLPVDAGLIPTGEIADVTGTAFDLRSARPMGEGMPRGGYDHNFCLGRTRQMRTAARAWDSGSGRRLTVSTDMPGLQFYTGNFLDASAAKNGMPMGVNGGFALETQYWPDSPNRPEFPSCLLRAGELWQSRTLYTFDLI